MKKLIFTSLALLALFVVSCQKEEIKPATEQPAVPQWESPEAQGRYGGSQESTTETGGTTTTTPGGEITDPGEEEDASVNKKKKKGGS